MKNIATQNTGFTYVKKRFRGLSYLSFMIGSAFSIFYPSVTIVELSSHTYAVIWAILFLASSAICFIGVSIQNWVIEYMGLPLLSVAFLVFSICLFLSVGPDSMNLVTFGFIFLGIATHLFSRFKELGHTITLNKAVRE